MTSLGSVVGPSVCPVVYQNLIFFYIMGLKLDKRLIEWRRCALNKCIVDINEPPKKT